MAREEYRPSEGAVLAGIQDFARMSELNDDQKTRALGLWNEYREKLKSSGISLAKPVDGDLQGNVAEAVLCHVLEGIHMENATGAIVAFYEWKNKKIKFSGSLEGLDVSHLILGVCSATREAVSDVSQSWDMQKGMLFRKQLALGKPFLDAISSDDEINRLLCEWIGYYLNNGSGDVNFFKNSLREKMQLVIQGVIASFSQKGERGGGQKRRRREMEDWRKRHMSKEHGGNKLRGKRCRRDQRVNRESSLQ